MAFLHKSLSVCKTVLIERLNELIHTKSLECLFLGDGKIVVFDLQEDSTLPEASAVSSVDH